MYVLVCVICVSMCPYMLMYALMRSICVLLCFICCILLVFISFLAHTGQAYMGPGPYGAQALPNDAEPPQKAEKLVCPI